MSSIVSAVILPLFARAAAWLTGRAAEVAQTEVVDFPRAIDALFDDDFFDEEVRPIS